MHIRIRKVEQQHIRKQQHRPAYGLPVTFIRIKYGLNVCCVAFILYPFNDFTKLKTKKVKGAFLVSAKSGLCLIY